MDAAWYRLETFQRIWSRALSCVARRPFFQRIAIAIMVVAVAAFTLQSVFVAASEAATGDSSHYYLDFVFSQVHDGEHSHVVTHRHADGTVHQHAVDDGSLAKHVKTPGAHSMAQVIFVLPAPGTAAIVPMGGRRLLIEQSHRLKTADLVGLHRPPRPRSIA